MNVSGGLPSANANAAAAWASSLVWPTTNCQAKARIKAGDQCLNLAVRRNGAAARAKAGQSTGMTAVACPLGPQPNSGG